MQPELEVDARLLHSIAAKVEEAATALRLAEQAAGSGLAPPPQPGSAAAAAAQSVAQSWSTDLRQLHRELDALAVNLTGAAKDYQATDQAGARALRDAGKSRPS
ncbi:type VII secretion target [Actinoplanes sp. NPDC051859]|uniref:type VII secretion target n=1 Tax=Actinoplanes sp. NPDC051859 TaxID=3363909 RepID=UPI0037B0374D